MKNIVQLHTMVDYSIRFEYIRSSTWLHSRRESGQVRRTSAELIRDGLIRRQGIVSFERWMFSHDFIFSELVSSKRYL